MAVLGKDPGADLAPSFDIGINGTGIDANLGRLVTSVEYDSMDGGADELKIKLSNPDLILSDKKIMGPGNTIQLWGGYGPQLEFIGAGKAEKVRPTFPGGQSMPTVEIVAYTADKLMMRNSPAPIADGAAFVKKPKSKKDPGRVWPAGSLYSDAVRQKAIEYGFNPDVDITPPDMAGPLGVVQKTGMDDFKFISGIANELGWLFWVDANELGGWTLHFKDPNHASEIQDVEYDFQYNSGNQSTLLSASCELLLGSAPTQVQVQLKNPKTNKLETFSVNTGDTAIESPEYVGFPNEVDLRPPKNAQEVTIAFGGTAVRVIADRVFSSPGEVKVWLKAWALKHTQDFVKCDAQVTGPGTHLLTARQVHRVSGLPGVYSGAYYLTKVTQKYSAQGHVVSWSGRKVSS